MNLLREMGLFARISFGGDFMKELSMVVTLVALLFMQGFTEPDITFNEGRSRGELNSCQLSISYPVENRLACFNRSMQPIDISITVWKDDVVVDAEIINIPDRLAFSWFYPSACDEQESDIIYAYIMFDSEIVADSAWCGRSFGQPSCMGLATDAFLNRFVLLDSDNKLEIGWSPNASSTDEIRRINIFEGSGYEEFRDCFHRLDRG